ncbi:MAG: hypothetical protein ABR509_02855 [Candidatus Limnocylindria bacterium]
MQFLKRKDRPAAEAAPIPLHADAPGQQYAIKIHLMARSSDGVRMRGRDAFHALNPIVDRLSTSRVEVLEPLPTEYRNAAPRIEHVEELDSWIRARSDAGPVGRHALYVLETLDALDMTVDTFVCGLLHGTTEASGYPDYQAIVGGVASRWDEMTGELTARAVVGWGGKGLRGDTNRHAEALVNAIYAELVASGSPIGADTPPGPVATGEATGLVCAHCGFEMIGAQAFFCIRCGMRMSRGA